MAIALGMTALEEICKALDLPRMTNHVVIDIPVDGAVTVYVKHFLDGERITPFARAMAKAKEGIRRVDVRPDANIVISDNGEVTIEG
jgi:hypothetical protein